MDNTKTKTPETQGAQGFGAYVHHRYADELA